jgi:hypothetical protein
MASMDAGLGISYGRSDWSSSMNFDASQDLKRPEDSDISSLQLALRRRNIFLDPKVSASLPVSKDQRLRQSLIVGTTLSIRADSNPDLLSNKRLSGALTLSATRNFHTYQQKTDGSVNTQYSSRQGLEAGYQFTEKISLGVSVSHIDTFSYFGGHREFYSHSQELGFKITKATTLTLGHQLGAPAASIRKANGQDYNFQLTDETQSIVYASLSVSI